MQTYGTLERAEDGRSRLRFTRVLEHPIEKVWRAVSEPEHLAHWFPTTIDGERAAGAALRFAFPRGQAEPFEGEMLAFEPPSLIELRWGEDVVRIELESRGAATQLTLIDTLAEHGKAARDSAGWHTCLDALAAHLRGERRPREELAAWREVHATYVESFGPDAATIGPPDSVQQAS